ncbi:LCP family protein [Paenibacillus shunpengii]|uniref:LCP family protein n=1 Tax=Paenibacillus shunpengii TaxID=2054424 RepID=A0ABW5SHX5_9BACL
MKRWLKISLVSVAAIVTVGLGFVWYMYASLETTANTIYEPREAVVPVTDIGGGQESAPAVQPKVEKIKEVEPFSVLLLGVDERANDVGRSDTIIVLTVNPQKQSIQMFNIPRDTRTEIVGRGSVDKINHAYAFGGINMSIQTVEQFLEIPIDYYVKLNMEGFVTIIDLLGGVNVNNPFEFEIDGSTFKQGDIQLSGEEALLYSRMRYDDPRGDLGRNTRQQEIVQELMKNALQVSSVMQIQNILDEVGGNVKTDITFDEMKKFVLEYASSLKKIDTMEINGHGQRINGIYYYIVDEQERQRVTDAMNEHMNEVEPS